MSYECERNPLGNQGPYRFGCGANDYFRSVMADRGPAVEICRDTTGPGWYVFSV